MSDYSYIVTNEEIKNSTKTISFKVRNLSLIHIQMCIRDRLNSDEIKIIESIIEQGKQVEVEEQGEKENKYWKLGWYSALKDIEPFKDKYLSLSKELNITSEHYESLGEIRVRSGSVSPFTIDELLGKNNQEIVEYIKTFNPHRSFDEPSISGLSCLLYTSRCV